IMIGSDETAKKFLNYTTSNVFFGIRVVGLIDDNPKGKALSGKFPILGPTSKATEIIKGTGVQNVLILAPKMDPKKLNLLVDELFPLVKNVSFVPDTEEMPVSNMELHRLYSENLIVLSVKNNLSRWYNQFVKRVFDMVVSVIGTLLISPFLLVIAILIKATSPGPAIYAHMRLGRHGKMFPCYKFRSMVKDADKKLAAYLASNPSAKAEWEREQKLKNDPRVTRVGMFLRKTSLDELPQLFNVIIGDMSLVGPRPITRSEVCKYGTYFSDYEMVRPGMTGLWQTSGRSDTSYDRRVRLDAWYVRNWNLWLDISMLVKTVRVLLSKDSGAY
uniref:exopolysaccharide biosynthesis polyprenyl glycosylphosphotransferase n=1 Tax=Turicimonas muris TaxID=1796652 RepID=UPI00266F1A57